MNKKWNHFIKGTLKKKLEFQMVLLTINEFLAPVFDAVVNEEEFFGNWDAGKLRYD